MLCLLVNHAGIRGIMENFIKRGIKSVKITPEKMYLLGESYFRQQVSTLYKEGGEVMDELK